MQVTIIGLRPVDFKAKDGNHIKGTSLFVAFPENGVTGNAAERVFASKEIELPKDLAPGSKVLLMYDRKGKIQSVVANAG